MKYKTLLRQYNALKVEAVMLSAELQKAPLGQYHRKVFKKFEETVASIIEQENLEEEVVSEPKVKFNVVGLAGLEPGIYAVKVSGVVGSCVNVTRVEHVYIIGIDEASPWTQDQMEYILARFNKPVDAVMLEDTLSEGGQLPAEDAQMINGILYQELLND